MTAYTFCIDSIVRGYHDYQSVWDFSSADGDLLCVQETYGKFAQSTGCGYQEDDWWYPASCWARVKENIFNLFDIPKKRWQYYTHMWLYYRFVNIWMVKIWRIFSQSSILLNFHDVEVSLHTVLEMILKICNFKQGNRDWRWKKYANKLVIK